MSGDLYWHCLQCGAHDPVQPTGDAVEYGLGDRERCIDCGDGTAHVVTLKMGAAYEQGRALGLTVKDAWARALGLASLAEATPERVAQVAAADRRERLEFAMHNGRACIAELTDSQVARILAILDEPAEGTYLATPKHPFRDALWHIVGVRPPAYVRGYSTRDMADGDLDALQSWVLAKVDETLRMSWSTGIGVIEAAELIVAEAVSNGNIPPPPNEIRDAAESDDDESEEEAP